MPMQGIADQHQRYPVAVDRTHHFLPDRIVGVDNVAEFQSIGDGRFSVLAAARTRKPAPVLDDGEMHSAALQRLNLDLRLELGMCFRLCFHRVRLS